MPRFTAILAGLALATALLSTPALTEPLSAERERALAPGATFTECAQCPEMVVVPAGSFAMGSSYGESGRNSWEHPQHVVKLERPFAVGKFEVTVDQFAAFVRDTGYRAGNSCWTFEKHKFDLRPNRSWRNPGYDQDGSHPAACLSWNNARAYVDWLAKKTGQPYRLLSEAEWEYAGRAATTPEEPARYGFGDNDDAICRHGNGFDQTAKHEVPGTTWWSALPCFDGYPYTAPVGSFAANDFGLHDMLGNVKEWTADCFHHGQGYRHAPDDGSVWTSGDCNKRVLRGGSWLSYARLMRVAFRYKNPPNDRLSDVGLRVARTLLSP